MREQRMLAIECEHMCACVHVCIVRIVCMCALCACVHCVHAAAPRERHWQTYTIHTSGWMDVQSEIECRRLTVGRHYEPVCMQLHREMSLCACSCTVRRACVHAAAP